MAWSKYCHLLAVRLLGAGERWGRIATGQGKGALKGGSSRAGAAAESAPNPNWIKAQPRATQRRWYKHTACTGVTKHAIRYVQHGQEELTACTAAVPQLTIPELAMQQWWLVSEVAASVAGIPGRVEGRNRVEEGSSKGWEGQ